MKQDEFRGLESVCALLFQGCAFLPEMGLCRTGSVVLPLPLGQKLVVQMGSRAWSILGVPGLCWRGWELSRLALGHPFPSSHHQCQAAASGLCPCAVPRLIIPGRRRRAAVPSLPEHILLLLLFILLLPRGLCVPRAAATPLCWHTWAVPVPCPVSLLQGDAKTSITSTCVPSGISSVHFAYFSSRPQAFALDFLILEEKNSL